VRRDEFQIGMAVEFSPVEAGRDPDSFFDIQVSGVVNSVQQFFDFATILLSTEESARAVNPNSKIGYLSDPTRWITVEHKPYVSWEVAFASIRRAEDTPMEDL
jgi:hypothetical protein